MFLFNRAFLNPLLLCSGIPTLVTGVFLLVKIKSYLIVYTHEIGSLLFAVACLLHLVVNWKPLLHSMKGRLPGWSVAALFIVVTIGMAYSAATADPSKRPHKTRSAAATSFAAPRPEQNSFAFADEGGADSEIILTNHF